MNITEFLEARIAEDEAVARAASTGPWFRDSGWSISAPSPEGWDGPFVVVETPRARNDSEFVARHDPSRVLAECAAKRATVGFYEFHRRNRDARRSTRAAEDERAAQDRRTQEARTRVAEDALRALASVYKDHPDYDPEWAL